MPALFGYNPVMAVKETSSRTPRYSRELPSGARKCAWYSEYIPEPDTEQQSVGYRRYAGYSVSREP